ncbi:hypothetical protein J4E80_006870 [Alternaria sp. BMP 0032]|nr:hypothetical protein J4E80_006870 [Alternaria sp. BMP 0032]
MDNDQNSPDCGAGNAMTWRKAPDAVQPNANFALYELTDGDLRGSIQIAIPKPPSTDSIQPSSSRCESPKEMDSDTDVANASHEVAATRRIVAPDLEAEDWPEAAPVPDTGSTHSGETKFANAVVPASLLALRDADSAIASRPWTADLVDLTMKRSDDNAASSEEGAKEEEAASEEEHHQAAERLFTDYVMRGGVSQDRVPLAKTEFMKVLSSKFWESKKPEAYLLDLASHLMATTKTTELSQTKLPMAAGFETAPVDTFEFLEFARKQMVERSVEASERLGYAMSMAKCASTKKQGLQIALEPLRIHVVNLAGLVKDLKAIHHSVLASSGGHFKSITDNVEYGVRQLEMIRDDFVERVQGIEEEAGV